MNCKAPKLPRKLAVVDQKRLHVLTHLDCKYSMKLGTQQGSERAKLGAATHSRVEWGHGLLHPSPRSLEQASTKNNDMPASIPLIILEPYLLSQLKPVLIHQNSQEALKMNHFGVAKIGCCLLAAGL